MIMRNFRSLPAVLGFVALVATLSASGRRLFIEYEGDVLRTNVASYMFNRPE